MAQPNSSTPSKTGATTSAVPETLHQPHDWLMLAAKRDPDAQFASTVIDVARGAKAIASILASHLIDLNAINSGAGQSVRTLLSENETESLARLAYFALDQLSVMAENRVDYFNAQAAAGAQA